MKGCEDGWCTSLALLWELMEPNIDMLAHKQRWEGPYADSDPWVPWRRNVICSFVCQDHRGRAVTLSFYSNLFFFPLAPLLFIPYVPPIAFSECNLVWWAGGLFWISQCFWLPPLACGAFSWSQSCRPGLEGRRRRRRRSSKSLGIGDLNALQSEPCRAQTERVILLQKLSAAPQMAFVRGQGHALGTGLKPRWASLLAQQVQRRGPDGTEKAKRYRRSTFPPWIRTADRDKIGGLQLKEDFTSQHTHKHAHTHSTEWD